MSEIYEDLSPKERDEKRRKLLEDVYSETSHGKVLSSQLEGNSTRIKTDRINDLGYKPLNIEYFPCSQFYEPGFEVSIRSAKVAEIQHWSTIDNSNYYDIQQKMSDMIASCAKVTLPGGRAGSYRNIKNEDKLYLVLCIRDLTFINRKKLLIPYKCNECGHKGQVPIERENLEIIEPPQDLQESFRTNSRSYEFELLNNQIIRIAPPTMGLMQDIFTHTKNAIISEGEGAINISFIKTMPSSLFQLTQINEKDFKTALNEYSKIDEETFEFLDTVAHEMEYGIKGVLHKCESCDREVSTPLRFPDGYSSLFIQRRLKDLLKSSEGME